MAGDHKRILLGAPGATSIQDDGARRRPRHRHLSLVICHLSFALGLWSSAAWGAAALDLACPRVGPALTPPARPALVPDTGEPRSPDLPEQAVRRLRDLEAREVQQNLLRSEAEARREAGRFIPGEGLRALDPGEANSPEGTIDTPTPAFTWIPITAATSYDVRVVRSDGWSLIETALATPFSLSRPLAFGWRYRWFYRAQNAEAGPGPWCPGGTFDLGTDRLAAPELLVPRGLLSVQETRTLVSPTPTFRWRPVPRAARYLLVLETVEGDPVHESWVDATSYVMPFGLEPGERYRWQVTPWNPVEGEGWPSADGTFETRAPPLAAPTPEQPTTTAAANPPSFGWTSVRGATLYRLILLRDEGTPVLDAWTAQAAYTPPRPLAPGAAYRWSVRAWNAREGEGPESPQTPFEIAPVQPEKENTGGNGDNPPEPKTP